jgi:hypothetical protein
VRDSKPFLQRPMVSLTLLGAQDLRDLFRLEPAELEASTTQRQLDQQHGHQRCYSPELTQHLQFLQGIRSFAGVTPSHAVM